MIQSFLKIQKNKNPKVLSCGYNAKISSRLICLSGDDYRPLEFSIYLFIFFIVLFFLFVWNATFLRVSLLLIGILLLRPDESIKTSDSY